MTPAQLQAFVTVAQLNSFTSAAMMLGITQSAVSHAIRTLEEELGIALFTRGKTEVVLTEAGQEILGKAHSILGLHESIRQTADEAKNLQQGVLKIGSFGPSFSARLLPVILSEYNKRYPNIRVYVEEGEDKQVKDWIAHRQVDLGCIILPENDLDHIFLARDKLAVLLSDNHPLTNKDRITVRDVCEHPFILTEGSTGRLALDLFRRHKCQPDIHYNNIQIMSMLSLVEGNAGISITAELSIPDHQQQKSASYVTRPLHPDVNREIALAMHNREHLSPAAAAFVKLAAGLERAGKFRIP